MTRLICRLLFAVVRNWPSTYFRPFPWGGHLRNALARRILDACRAVAGSGAFLDDFSLLEGQLAHRAAEQLKLLVADQGLQRFFRQHSGYIWVQLAVVKAGPVFVCYAGGLRR